MKIKSITIDNFRGYKDPVTIPFDNLTVFVGKNDIGKSTILEALDIFFNDSKAIHKLEKDEILSSSFNLSRQISSLHCDTPIT